MSYVILMAEVKIGKKTCGLFILLVPPATETLLTVCTLAGGCCG